MGCSHYIKDVKMPIRMVVQCYECGEIIDPEHPDHGCLSYDPFLDDGLKVNITISNTQER